MIYTCLSTTTILGTVYGYTSSRLLKPSGQSRSLHPSASQSGHSPMLQHSLMTITGHWYTQHDPNVDPTNIWATLWATPFENSIWWPIVANVAEHRLREKCVRLQKWSLQLRHLRQNILSGPLEMTIIESPGDPSRSSTVPGITSTFRMLSWEKLWLGGWQPQGCWWWPWWTWQWWWRWWWRNTGQQKLKGRLCETAWSQAR